MKSKITMFAIVLALTSISLSTVVKAQEEESSPVDVGLDIYSSYIWRGAKFGNGAAFQPWIEGTAGNLAIGAWGSVNNGGLSDFSASPEAFEMDLYLSYSFDFGLSIGVTDYYFGSVDGDSIDFDMDAGEIIYESLGYFSYDAAHYIEPIISFETGNISITAAYLFAPNFEEGDTYLEASYSLPFLDITLGIGDGAYTDDGEFNICNISLGSSKEIEITDKFSLPISGGVTLNPATEGFYIYAGISF